VYITPVGILSERLYVDFITSLFLHGEELLDPHSTSNMEDCPLMAVRDYLFNIFTATFLSWGLSPQTAT
jgi:hypothetical protein